MEDRPEKQCFKVIFWILMGGGERCSSIRSWFHNVVAMVKKARPLVDDLQASLEVTTQRNIALEGLVGWVINIGKRHFGR